MDQQNSETPIPFDPSTTLAAATEVEQSEASVANTHWSSSPVPSSGVGLVAGDDNAASSSTAEEVSMEARDNLKKAPQHCFDESLPSEHSSASTNAMGLESSYFSPYDRDDANDEQSVPDEDISYGAMRHRSMSPDTAYRIPPAPPSTPASQPNGIGLSLSFEAMRDVIGGPPTSASSISSPISPMFTTGGHVVNSEILQQSHFFGSGQLTPAPTSDYATKATAPNYAAASTLATPKPSQGGTVDAMATPKPSRTPPVPLPEDFSDWSVGNRYELIRILGRGSYGEVAQAIDVRKTKAMNGEVAYVAIKRIQSPFEQQLDAVRLYREIHILRRMKEGGDGTTNSTEQSRIKRHHDCIIQLLDVVQPAALNDFHELYLVFECMYSLCRTDVVALRVYIISLIFLLF
jgi:hypothetical protein